MFLVLQPEIVSTKFFKEMYGDHSGEFVFGDWDLKGWFVKKPKAYHHPKQESEQQKKY